MSQPSTVDLLPDDIKARLQELLRDPRVTQLDATRRINEILEAEGHDRLSKSSVNRYAVRMEKVGRKIRQGREVAKMWIGKLGAEPQGEVGKLLNEMVRSLAFEAAMTAAESTGPIEPKMLKDLALAVQRLEKAAKSNIETERKIREQLKEEAARAVEAEAKRQGASATTIDKLREAIMSEINS